MKTLPSPGVLCTDSLPPSSCARSREIDRPRPVPPYLRVIELSAWLKAWNRWGSRSGGMPMPVSVTVNFSRILPSGAPSSLASIRTEPCCVNLMALLIRFEAICCKRCGSPR